MTLWWAKKALVLAVLAAACTSGGPAQSPSSGSEERPGLAEDWQASKRRLNRLIEEQRFSDARTLAKELLSEAESAGDNNRVVDMLVTLAAVSAGLGEREPAEVYLRRADSLIRQGYGKRHRQLVASVLGRTSADGTADLAFLESVYATRGTDVGAVPRVVELLGHPDAGVRKFAAFVLGTFGERGSVGKGRLLGLLLDEDEEVRVATAMALAQQGPAVVPSLMTYVDFPDTDVRAAAFLALSQMEGSLDRALASAFEQLSARNRRATIEMAGRPGLLRVQHHPELDARIEKAATDDPSRDVRRAARTYTMVRLGRLSRTAVERYETSLEHFEQSLAGAASVTGLPGGLPREYLEASELGHTWGDFGEALARRSRPEARHFFEKALGAGTALGALEQRDLELRRAMLPGARAVEPGPLRAALGNVLKQGANPGRLDLLLIATAVDRLQSVSDPGDWQSFARQHTAQLDVLERSRTVILLEITAAAQESRLQRLGAWMLAADQLKELGRLEEAAALYARAYATREEKAAVALTAIAAHHTEYLDVLLALGRPADAFEVSEWSRGFEARLLGLDGSQLAESSLNLVEVLREYSSEQYEWLMAFLRRHASASDSFVPRAFVFHSARKANMGRLRTQSRSTRPAKEDWDERKMDDALGENAALFDFSQFRDHVVTPEGKSSWGAYRYAAFVRSKGQLSWVDLGESEPVDRLAREFRKAILRPGNARARKEVTRLGRQLYDVLFAPLGATALAQPRWFVSLDGNLALIPFSALTGTDGKFLVESHEVVNIASSRELLPSGKPKPIDRALVIADPDFDLPLAPGRAGSPAMPTNPPSGGWPRLPGTRKEALQVQTAMSRAGAQVAVAEGAAATAELLLQPFDGEVLHVATHGYWVGSREPELELRAAADQLVLAQLLGDQRGVGGFAVPLPGRPPKAKAGSVGPTTLPTAGSAGLVLAGANRFGAAFVTSEVLAAAPPFRRLELAVLSACDTGLGSIWRGEGVQGLQSALFERGARNVMVSLWTIADEQTAVLMGEFYADFSRGVPAPAALAKAARSIQSRFPDPYYWAPFVVVAGGR